MPNIPLIYLAQPYAHRYKSVRQSRAKIGSLVAGALLDYGYDVFAPITHGHTIVQQYPLEFTHQQWLDYDFNILKRCDFMLALHLRGWEDSKGLHAEKVFCETNNIPYCEYTPLYLPSKKQYIWEWDELSKFIADQMKERLFNAD